MTDADTFADVYPATYTPFNKDGRIDFEQLRDDAQRLEALVTKYEQVEAQR